MEINKSLKWQRPSSPLNSKNVFFNNPNFMKLRTVSITKLDTLLSPAKIYMPCHTQI